MFRVKGSRCLMTDASHCPPFDDAGGAGTTGHADLRTGTIVIAAAPHRTIEAYADRRTTQIAAAASKQYR